MKWVEIDRKGLNTVKWMALLRHDMGRNRSKGSKYRRMDPFVTILLWALLRHEMGRLVEKVEIPSNGSFCNHSIMDITKT